MDNNNLEELSKNAKLASYRLSSSTNDERNSILKNLKELLISKKEEILKANQEDMLLADIEIKKGNYSPALIKRYI